MVTASLQMCREVAELLWFHLYVFVFVTFYSSETDFDQKLGSLIVISTYIQSPLFMIIVESLLLLLQNRFMSCKWQRSNLYLCY